MLIDNAIETIENVGNDFIDYIVKPAFRTTKDIILDETKINYFLKFKTEYLEQKLLLYIKFLKEKDDNQIIEFIEKLDNKDREFFVSCINKVFELDNKLHIYILAQLTKQYQTNKELNYFEESIYHNIAQLTSDDLNIFMELMLNKLKPSKNNKDAFPLENISNIEEIVAVKFSNIGIIRIVHGTFGGPFISKTEYSDKFANLIYSYNKTLDDE